MAEPEGGTTENKPQAGRPKDAEDVVCDDCGRIFRSRQGLATHKTRSHGYKDGMSPRDREVTREFNKRFDEASARLREEKAAGGRSVDQGTATGLPGQATEKIDSTTQIEKGPPPPRIVDAHEFPDTVDEFLPKLAEEIRMRKALGMNDVELVDAFFLLYNDARASR